MVFRAVPEIAYEVEAKQSTWDALAEVMKAPITHARGTARSTMAGAGYTMAGKTGTWEVPGSVSNGLYVGYAPAENPEILVAVVVERGGGGSSSAAPIARKILDAYFQRDIPDT